MQRRLSSFIKHSSSSTPPPTPQNEKTGDENNESQVSTVIPDEPLPVPSLKIKRVDLYYSRWSKSWKYRNTNPKVKVETLPVLQDESNDGWKEFSFVILRTLPKPMPKEDDPEPFFKIVVKSEYILKACKDVVQSWSGVSWNSDPLQLDPEIFITFHPEFLQYAADLKAKTNRSEQDDYTLSSVELLNSTIATDYRHTLATIERLTSHGEITFEHLYAILVPKSLMVTECAVTGLPRLFELTSWSRTVVENVPFYQLLLQRVDLVDRPATHSVTVGRVQATLNIFPVDGVVRIDSLDVYPLKYHQDPEGLKETILKRGRKWVSLIGAHHKQYDGIAAFRVKDKLLKQHVSGRIMIDRATFRRMNPNYVLSIPVPPKLEDGKGGKANSRFIKRDKDGNILPQQPVVTATHDLSVKRQPKDVTPEVKMSDAELLLTPTVVFGFSLGDKLWLEFGIDQISNIDWNTDAFANLVLPGDRKMLLKSLVDAHHRETDSKAGFDDFVKGKGRGLIINLFGPPGVGKTFSAEATSEHVCRPLYIVDGGDLGISAAALDKALKEIFDIATVWKAIVLIDEADVFLERREMSDLNRNAMVAVFLRHVEYYRGILFLTTNRVKAFDEAFLSRIHVALAFGELSEESKEQVWAAFISKMGDAGKAVTKAQIKELAKREINGRQIKNAARTAHSLALAKGEDVTFEHLRITLDALDEFTKEFERRSVGMYM